MSLNKTLLALALGLALTACTNKDQATEAAADANESAADATQAAADAAAMASDAAGTPTGDAAAMAADAAASAAATATDAAGAADSAAADASGMGTSEGADMSADAAEVADMGTGTCTAASTVGRQSANTTAPANNRTLSAAAPTRRGLRQRLPRTGGARLLTPLRPISTRLRVCPASIAALIR